MPESIRYNTAQNILQDFCMAVKKIFNPSGFDIGLWMFKYYPAIESLKTWAIIERDTKKIDPV